MNKFVVGLLLFSCTLYAREKIKLKNKLIITLDGVPYALDGPAFGDLVHVRSKVKGIQYGIRDSVTKELHGSY